MMIIKRAKEKSTRLITIKSGREGGVSLRLCWSIRWGLPFRSVSRHFWWEYLSHSGRAPPSKTADAEGKNLTRNVPIYTGSLTYLGAGKLTDYIGQDIQSFFFFFSWQWLKPFYGAHFKWITSGRLNHILIKILTLTLTTLTTSA